MKKLFFICIFFLLNFLVLEGQENSDLAYDSLTQQLSVKVKSLEKENIILEKQLTFLKKQDKAIFDSIETQKLYLLHQINSLADKLDSLVIRNSLQNQIIQDVNSSIWKKIEDQHKKYLSAFIILIIVLFLFFAGFFYRDYLLEKRLIVGLSEQRKETNSKIKKLKTDLFKMLKKKAERKKK